MIPHDCYDDMYDGHWRIEYETNQEQPKKEDKMKLPEFLQCSKKSVKTSTLRIGDRVIVDDGSYNAVIEDGCVSLRHHPAMRPNQWKGIIIATDCVLPTSNDQVAALCKAQDSIPPNDCLVYCDNGKYLCINIKYLLKEREAKYV